jgi:hypothetical protein
MTVFNQKTSNKFLKALVYVELILGGLLLLLVIALLIMAATLGPLSPYIGGVAEALRDVAWPFAVLGAILGLYLKINGGAQSPPENDAN